MNLYEILRVAKDATQKEIKDAYRKLAMIHHPDKGGDEAQFKQIVLAYSVLSDEDKRHQYDNGRSAEDIYRANNGQNDALKMVIEVFLQIVARTPTIKNINLFDAVRASVGETLREIDKDKNQIARQIEKFEAVKKRVISKGNENVFSQALDAQIQKANFDINALDRSYKIGTDGLKILEDYDYDFEAMQTLFNGNFTITMTEAYNQSRVKED